jgi:Tfp pilus assembly protein PilF
MSYRGKGELDKALEYIRKALVLRPLKTSHLNNYGVILAESGKLDEAKTQWRKVLEIDDNNATAKENLSALER